ncbi:MAG TPA: DUF222 domain-containing protein [Streptosporangiaceae bacterium]
MSDALAQLRAAFDYLNGSDAASEPGVVQAEVLRELERAESRHTAARARYLAAFAAQAEYEADGQGTARAWLKWQTQVTSGAAGGAAGWAKRLGAHPVIDRALAGGELSCSWARHLCAWTDRLPREARDNADQILINAAADGGMGLRDLAGLAEEIYHRTRPRSPSRDGGDSDEQQVFDDRFVRVGVTFGGAGHAEGALTAGCAHALTTVLEGLGKKAGPEDTRTAGQRRHDALAEACRRLIAAELVPGRAAQPTQLTVHMTLNQLLGLPGAGQAERAWLAAQATTTGGWLTGADAEAAACDATITPVVTGHLDPAALDQLTSLFQAAHAAAGGHATRGSGSPQAAGSPEAGSPGAAATGTGGRPGPAPATGPSGSSRPARGHPPGPGNAPPGTSQAGTGLAPATRDRLRRALLALAIQALSGPGGLAAHLMGATLTTPRPTDTADADAAGAAGAAHATGAAGAGTGTTAATAATGSGPPGPAVAGRALLASRSLPLDIGAATPTIPAHLRKAAALRHPHCAFPGCRQPFSVCDIHHLLPRSRGGPTSLPNLLPLCQFHHLTAIHRWGWTLQLHPDGTTTATSPDRSRTFHSHSPPGGRAA